MKINYKCRHSGESRNPGDAEGVIPACRKRGSTLNSVLDSRLRHSGMTALAFAGMTAIFLSIAHLHAADFPDTWANWNNRWEAAFANVNSHKLPGRVMGIITPADTRDDILPMSAFGYDTLSQSSYQTVIFLIEAPDDYPLEGLAMPGLDTIETSFGRFPIDTTLRDQIAANATGITVDPDLFVTDTPKILQRQLSGLKFVLKNNIKSLHVLPIYVKFSDINSGIKDQAPFLVDRIRSHGAEQDIAFVIVSNLNRTTSEEKLIAQDASLLKSIRNLDIDELLATTVLSASSDTVHEDVSALLLGALTLRWMGADHAEILAYAHSGQLVLTKNKKAPLSYVSAGFASRPPFSARVPHVPQEKIVDTFGELLRSDMLSLSRQTCLSTLDPTAAKPPAINQKEAAKKWPVYVSIFDPQGKLGGQAGSHVATGPLEESIRQYTFEAVRAAQPDLSKSNAANYVIELSVPYGFENLAQTDDLIPLLNGIVVSLKLKTKAIHPDAWRKYPDPHQLLGAICTRLGGEPWTYATTSAKMQSFRVLSFNEKEPFLDLGSSSKKKKKKGGDDENLDEGTGGGGGGSPFSF